MTRTLEQIMLAAAESKARVLGFLSPDRGAGVSTLCRLLAGGFVGAGIRTLLVDLTQEAVEENDRRPVWLPNLTPTSLIEADPAGYDVIQAPPTWQSRALFNNIDTLRRMFDQDLREFETIIVDLSSVLDRRENIINPVSVARACDAVIMVCVTGRTTQDQIKQTLTELDSAGVQLSATILNDVEAVVGQ